MLVIWVACVCCFCFTRFACVWAYGLLVWDSTCAGVLVGCRALAWVGLLLCFSVLLICGLCGADMFGLDMVLLLDGYFFSF